MIDGEIDTVFTFAPKLNCSDVNIISKRCFHIIALFLSHIFRFRDIMGHLYFHFNYYGWSHNSAVLHNKVTEV